jgi:hypothetical protein
MGTGQALEWLSHFKKDVTSVKNAKPEGYRTADQVMELVLSSVETLLAHARLNHAARAD